MANFIFKVNAQILTQKFSYNSKLTGTLHKNLCKTNSLYITTNAK
jgi:hypothetical protein